jgi:hypothetical protein
MKRESWTFLIVVLALLTGTATLLSRLQNNRRLGKPGVKLADQNVYDADGRLVGTNVVDLPERVLDYESIVEPVSQLVLDTLPRDTTYGQRLYKATDQFQIVLNVVLMGTDRTSIHKPQHCLSGGGWHIDQTTLALVPVSQPHPYELPITRLSISREVTVPGGAQGVQRGIYVYWFAADNELTAKHGQRMWWLARDLIRTGVLQRWAYVACLAECGPGDEERAFARMEAFIAAAVPQFELTAGPATTVARSP